MIPQLFEVVERHHDAQATYTLVARPGSGEEFHFVPGQFNMLYVFGKGEIPISISGSSAQGQQVVHTVQAVGAVSQAFTELKPGQRFGLRGPFGRGWPVEQAVGKDLVIMAGGLGLAPLRPVIYRVEAEREKFGRVAVLCGARSIDRLLFQEELKRWKAKSDIDVMVTLDLAEPGWKGHVGVVTGLVNAAAAKLDLSRSVAMVCGPHIMMRFSVKELLRAGVPADNVFVSVERNMKCGVGLCGHCQFGPYFLCRDGPVLSYAELRPWLKVREL